MPVASLFRGGGPEGVGGGKPPMTTQQNQLEQPPTIVVGAGMTGLAAAWELQQRGLPYVLLEAGDYFGGKVQSEPTEDGFLVEKAAEAITDEDALRLEEKIRTASFDLDDFLQQFKMIKRMGPLENVLGMIPGMDKLKDSSIDEKQLTRVEAIILSMTPQERTRPDILNARRRQRVARGSGTTVTEVNNLILRFSQMRKMMKNTGQMKKLMAQAGKNFGF